jgi:hypothetical protein
MNSVPFQMNIYAGWGISEGIISDEGNGFLRIEFQNRDKMGGFLKSGVKSLNVALKDLSSVTLSKGWLGMTWMGVNLVLQGKDMNVLKDVPGMKQGRVEMGIQRIHVAAAEKLVNDLYEEEVQNESKS